VEKRNPLLALLEDKERDNKASKLLAVFAAA